MAETPVINVYCDETCHLEHDDARAMVLGALWCPQPAVEDLHRRIAQLKAEHGLTPFFEIKWGKVSLSKLAFYEALLALFFDSEALHFRAWVIPDKTILRHEDHGHTHDDWYYKMYFSMLKVIIEPNNAYHIYLDIKDTRSRQKLAKLHEVLANANYDFKREIIARMQHVHSHDVGLMQLTDLMIGAIGYQARGLLESPAKLRLLEIIRQRSGLSLTQNTLPSASKVNICFWQTNRGVNDVC